jgi:hypothetical protein
MNADVFCAAYALQIVWSIIQCVAIAMVDQHARNNSLFIGCFPSDLRIFAPHIVNVVEGSATSRTKSRCFRSVGLNAELLSAVFALQVNRHDNHLRCPAYATSTPLSSLGSGTTLEREIARGRLFEPAETAPKPVQATLEVEP